MSTTIKAVVFSVFLTVLGFGKAHALTPGGWVENNWVFLSSCTRTAYLYAVSTSVVFCGADDFRTTMNSKLLLLQKASGLKSTILAMRALITEDASAYSVQINNQIAKLQRQVDIIVAYANSF